MQICGLGARIFGGPGLGPRVSRIEGTIVGTWRKGKQDEFVPEDGCNEANGEKGQKWVDQVGEVGRPDWRSRVDAQLSSLYSESVDTKG